MAAQARVELLFELLLGIRRQLVGRFGRLRAGFGRGLRLPPAHTGGVIHRHNSYRFGSVFSCDY
ncbi:Uncharacterised protein [Mycobacteroides abscessus subsp. abscessus]|nr:Uncharacterised protein [Mycobacteroides abscessus subsp. abscessus]